MTEIYIELLAKTTMQGKHCKVSLQENNKMAQVCFELRPCQS